MSGSNPVYQPTTVSYNRNDDVYGDGVVYVPTYAHQSQSRRLLPTAIFVGGVMVGILALSFIFVGARAGPSRPLAAESHESDHPAVSPVTTAAPVVEENANVTRLVNETLVSANATTPNATSSVTTQPPNVKLDDGHDHDQHLPKIDETEDDDHHDKHNQAVRRAESEGSSVLVGVGIFFLLVSVSMILYALYLRGYLNSCLPVKRRTYAQQLSRGVIDSGPLNGRH
jgi:hypothetical protein